MRHIVDEYLKPAELADKKNGGGDGGDDASKKTSNEPPANTGNITSIVPTPPNPADLKSPPPVMKRIDSFAGLQRRESESSVGSDDTVVEMGSSNTEKTQGVTVSLHDGIQRRTVPTPGRTQEPLLSRTSDKL
jgi:hypothetical protein